MYTPIVTKSKIPQPVTSSVSRKIQNTVTKVNANDTRSMSIGRIQPLGASNTNRLSISRANNPNVNRRISMLPCPSKLPDPKMLIDETNIRGYEQDIQNYLDESGFEGDVITRLNSRQAYTQIISHIIRTFDDEEGSVMEMAGPNVNNIAEVLNVFGYTGNIKQSDLNTIAYGNSSTSKKLFLATTYFLVLVAKLMHLKPNDIISTSTLNQEADSDKQYYYVTRATTFAVYRNLLQDNHQELILTDEHKENIVTYAREQISKFFNVDESAIADKEANIARLRDELAAISDGERPDENARNTLSEMTIKEAELQKEDRCLEQQLDNLNTILKEKLDLGSRLRTQCNQMQSIIAEKKRQIQAQPFSGQQSREMKQRKSELLETVKLLSAQIETEKMDQYAVETKTSKNMAQLESNYSTLISSLKDLHEKLTRHIPDSSLLKPLPTQAVRPSMPQFNLHLSEEIAPVLDNIILIVDKVIRDGKNNLLKMEQETAEARNQAELLADEVQEENRRYEAELLECNKARLETNERLKSAKELFAILIEQQSKIGREIYGDEFDQLHNKYIETKKKVDKWIDDEDDRISALIDQSTPVFDNILTMQMSNDEQIDTIESAVNDMIISLKAVSDELNRLNRKFNETADTNAKFLQQMNVDSNDSSCFYQCHEC